MHASNFKGALKVEREVLEKLTVQDRTAFDFGFTYFFVEFSQHISKDLSEQDRERAFVEAFDGLTPRQVIILGYVMRTELLKQADPYSQEPKGKERSDRESHLKSHLYSFEDEAIHALQKYGSRANKSVEVTPTAVTPVADAPGAPSAGAPHH